MKYINGLIIVLSFCFLLGIASNSEETYPASMDYAEAVAAFEIRHETVPGPIHHSLFKYIDEIKKKAI
ncbi:hypothetical protein [Anaerospora sp.]|uniref:hypothetical protein n=1 Tax=Anaerospora sp. TaxID=1960278 RepID=UPI0028A295D4|nr:hypothetical protein [Anaerospora sp.]